MVYPKEIIYNLKLDKDVEKMRKGKTIIGPSEIKISFSYPYSKTFMTDIHSNNNEGLTKLELFNNIIKLFDSFPHQLRNYDPRDVRERILHSVYLSVDGTYHISFEEPKEETEKEEKVLD